MASEQVRRAHEDKQQSTSFIDTIVRIEDSRTASANAEKDDNGSESLLMKHLNVSFLNSEEKQEQFSLLTNSSLKTALFMVLEWVPFLFQLYFIGKIQDKEKTGGFGMGLVWSNCFAVGLFGGLGVGVETLASFAFGGKKYKMTGIIFQRGVAIASVTMIPIIFLMWYSDVIIGSVSGKVNFGIYAAQYCRYGIPAFYFSGIYNIFKGFLTAQNEYHIPLITVSITSVTSIFWSWLFIEGLEYGIAGAAIARTITEAMNLSIVYYLVRKYRIHERCPIKLTKLAFQEWGNFLKFVVPIGSLLTLEWLSYELFTFQASRLSDESASAHVIMNNVNTVYYQFGYGLSIAITTFVGNEMGAKNISKAVTYAKQGMVIALTFLLLTQLPFSMMKDQFAELFSILPETQNELRNMFTIFQAGMILDTFLACVTGVTRGIGKQNFAAASFVFSYLIVGQIISYVLGTVFEFGLFGIWVGVVFGMIVTTGAQAWCIGTSDWKKLLEIIQENIANDEKRTQELMLAEAAAEEEDSEKSNAKMVPFIPRNHSGETESQGDLKDRNSSSGGDIEMNDIKPKDKLNY